MRFHTGGSEVRSGTRPEQSLSNRVHGQRIVLGTVALHALHKKLTVRLCSGSWRQGFPSGRPEVLVQRNRRWRRCELRGNFLPLRTRDMRLGFRVWVFGV